MSKPLHIILNEGHSRCLIFWSQRFVIYITVLTLIMIMTMMIIIMIRIFTIMMMTGLGAALTSWSRRPGSGRWSFIVRRSGKVFIVIIIIFIIIVFIVFLIIIICIISILIFIITITILRSWEVLQFQFFASWHLEGGGGGSSSHCW